jgi:RNA polymerase sigma factor (TIGR02999 family)
MPDPAAAGGMPTLPSESSPETSRRGSTPRDAAARSAADVTGLLRAWAAGEPGAVDALFPAVYEELRRQARRAMRRESEAHTLQPTALVHEVYLRLVDQRQARWESRSQFFAVAAQAMRRVLVDHARTRRRAKRGSGRTPLALEQVDVAELAPDAGADIDVLDLDEALTRFAVVDPRKARLVELRYFGGLSIPEAAAVLGVSAATVTREWAVARAWLRRELGR